MVIVRLSLTKILRDHKGAAIADKGYGRDAFRDALTERSP